MGQIVYWIVISWPVSRRLPADKDIEYFGPFNSESDARVFGDDCFDTDIYFKVEPLHM